MADIDNVTVGENNYNLRDSAAQNALPTQGQVDDIIEALDIIAVKSNTPYNASNKLPTDYADDTNQTHKFATAAQLSQIETNKNNILTVADQSTQYNIVPIKSTITTGNASVTATVAADKSITIEITGTTSSNVGFEISDNFTIDTNAEYVMTGNPSAGTTRLVLQQAASPYNWIGQQYNNQAAAVTSNISLVRYYVFIYSGSSGTITIKPMLTPKSLWDKGFTQFQPYAMSNVELTEKNAVNENNISYISKNNVINIFTRQTGTYSHNGVTFTTNIDGSISLSGTASGGAAVLALSITLDTTDDTYILYGDGFIEGIYMDTYEDGWANQRTFTTWVETVPNTKIWRLIVSNGTNADGVTIRPMMCGKSLFDNSYHQYAMSNAELTALVLKVASATYALNNLIWSVGTDGMIYSNATVVNGITSIYSAIITGFGRLRATDVIVPILSNDCTQIRFMANNSSWITDAYVTLRIVGI